MCAAVYRRSRDTSQNSCNARATQGDCESIWAIWARGIPGLLAGDGFDGTRKLTQRQLLEFNLRARVVDVNDGGCRGTSGRPRVPRRVGLLLLISNDAIDRVD